MRATSGGCLVQRVKDSFGKLRVVFLRNNLLAALPELDLPTRTRRPLSLQPEHALPYSAKELTERNKQEVRESRQRLPCREGRSQFSEKRCSVFQKN